MSSAEPKAKIKPDLALAKPSLYRIIYLNDDKTTMEFVVSTLINHFDYTVDTAAVITQDIHEKGSAVVAVLPYEIAEHKGVEITLEARTSGFPLKVMVEEDI